MIAPFNEIVGQQRDAGRAVGAFTCYDLATAAGVLRAAEIVNAPVILLLSNASFIARDGRLLASGLIAAADRATAIACVQLDHVDDLRTIEQAVKLGIGAVMADGSRLSLEDNARFVRAAVKLARERNVGVEAELGHIEGGEDVAAAVEAGALTDPDDARAFVGRSGADCLAVSIGNVHGIYASPPDLDWPRLEAICARVSVPLSLHGTSGLPASDVAAAVRAGIAKVNLNAELRRRAFQELKNRLPEFESGYRMLELQDALSTAAAEVAVGTLRHLQGET